jgi:Arc/MetJ-type ribon-helix-helix transcriptional regulator
MRRQREDKIIEGGWSTVSIPTEWQQQIFDICKAKKYASISEFVREAIREKMRTDVLGKKQEPGKMSEISLPTGSKDKIIKLCRDKKYSSLTDFVKKSILEKLEFEDLERKGMEEVGNGNEKSSTIKADQ